MTFFKPYEWLTHALARAERKARTVNAKSWHDECLRLLTTEATDEDRDKAEQLRRVWLASVEAGC